MSLLKDIVKTERSWIRALALAALLLARVASPLAAQDVQPGVDIWTSPGQGTSSDDFSLNPIPADFFDPGSDPFADVVEFIGFPLFDLNAAVPLPFDTVVERQAPANLPEVGSVAEVPIEIKALSLVSAQPITVTFNGGQNPQLWDLNVCLSSQVSQQQGTMTLRKTCDQGGTFDSQLPVTPKLVFIRQSDFAVRVLDPAPPIFLRAQSSRWVHDPAPSLNVISIPPGIVTDGNCDGIPDPPLAGTNINFAPGIWDLSCEPTCQVVPPGEPQRKRLTQEAEMLAAHGVTIAQDPPPDMDGDGHPDDADNCAADPNPLQEDIDNDSVGDVCDNCPSTPNPCQEDADMDGTGDACEGLIFVDGFESGSVSAWSNAVPPVVPPVASFTFAVVALTVDFTDTSGGNPTAWVWDFGDSSGSTDQNPTHVYTVIGTYTVTLTVSNNAGSDSVSVDVTVP